MKLFLSPRHMLETIFALGCIGVVAYLARSVIVPSAKPVFGAAYLPVDFSKVGPVLAAVCIALGVRSDLEPMDKLAARPLHTWRTFYCSAVILTAFTVLLPSALRGHERSMVTILLVNIMAASGLTLIMVSIVGWLATCLVVIPYGLLGLQAGQAMPHFLHYIFLINVTPDLLSGALAALVLSIGMVSYAISGSRATSSD